MLNFFSPAACTMRLPVTVEPVNEMARTSGCATSGSPASLAVAVHHVQHARRDAGFQRQLAQPRRVIGDSFAHLQHRGVAEREAGATFQVAVMNGTFHGEISAHAHRVEQRVVQVRRRRVVCPSTRVHISAK